MLFAVKSLYPTEWQEAIVTAFLTVVALRSFEYIVKTLLVSAGPECVSTSQFALAIAADQAWNPLKMVSWARGNPDFPVNRVISSGRPGQPQRKIPVQRATIAVLIALLALVAEGAFFWGTQTKTVSLTDSQLQIAMKQTNINHDTKMGRDTCEPINVKEGRAKLSAVLAACNIERGVRPSVGLGKNLTAIIEKGKYSMQVKIQGDTNISSETTFTILVQNNENLLVPLTEDLQQAPVDAVRKYYEELGCTLEGAKFERLTLRNCLQNVDPHQAMQIIVRYIEVVNDGPGGKDIGIGVGGSVVNSPGNVKVGIITRQNFTAVGILAITGALFLIAIICGRFVKDDTNEVIACILRERTEQDPRTPAVAMGDGKVSIIRSVSKSTQEWHVGTTVPDGYEEKSE